MASLHCESQELSVKWLAMGCTAGVWFGEGQGVSLCQYAQMSSTPIEPLKEIRAWQWCKWNSLVISI
jgi:hypothetical protein